MARIWNTPLLQQERLRDGNPLRRVLSGDDRGSSWPYPHGYRVLSVKFAAAHLDRRAKLVFCNSNLNKSTTVCKVGDLEVPAKPFWIWKHIRVHKVHVYEMYAHEVHAYEVHAHKAHAREVHAREVHAYEVHAREVHACEAHAYEVHARKVHAYEVHAREVHAYEVHAREVHAYEVHGDARL